MTTVILVYDPYYVSYKAIVDLSQVLYVQLIKMVAVPVRGYNDKFALFAIRDIPEVSIEELKALVTGALNA